MVSAVAVRQNSCHVQKVIGRFALRPQPLLATTEKGHFTFCFGFFEGFGIHVAQHEYFAGQAVLNNGGKEPVGRFLKIEFLEH